MQPLFTKMDEIMLTLRLADINDALFCYEQVISEVKQGHFDKRLGCVP